jgi:hypothetical protein
MKVEIESCFYSAEMSVISQGCVIENKLKLNVKKFENLELQNIKKHLLLPSKCIFNQHLIVQKLFPKNKFYDLENEKNDLIDTYNYLLENKKIILQNHDVDSLKSVFLALSGLSPQLIKKIYTNQDLNLNLKYKKPTGLAW